MADDLILVLDNNRDEELVMDDGDDTELEFNAPITTDYNKLHNRPLINNVILTGNKFLQDLFPDGIIIDGGTSTEVV